MQVRAEIRSLNNKSGISSKSGKAYSIDEVLFIDTEAPRQEILTANVHENDLALVRGMVGKTVPCHFFTNSGNIRFGGQIVKATA